MTNPTALAAALAAVFTGETPPVEPCGRCYQGRIDNDCTCTTVCNKLYCEKRYEHWDGSWDPLCYTTDYRSQPVPVLPTQRGATNGG